MTDFSGSELMRGIQALRGQLCTLSHQRGIADELTRRGYMRFHEWPSGHWAVTDKGRAFMVGFADEEAERQQKASW